MKQIKKNALILVLLSLCVVTLVLARKSKSEKIPVDAAALQQAELPDSPVSALQPSAPIEVSKASISPVVQQAIDKIIAETALPRVPDARGLIHVDGLAEHLVLERRVTDLGTGDVERLFVVDSGASYPFLRVEERLKYDEKTDEFVVAWQRVIVADHFLVKLKPGVPVEKLEELNRLYGTTTLEAMGFANKYIVQLPKPTLDDVIRVSQLFETEKEWVERVHFNSVSSPSAVPNDPRWSQQWDKHRIGCPDAWDKTTGSSNVIVAVLDTGVDLDHPDLAANIWENLGETGALGSNGVDDDGNGYIDDQFGWDFGQNDNNPDDNGDTDHGGTFSAGGHGTHCAGIIGAVGNNSTLIAGVCWNVSIMAVKTMEYIPAAGYMASYDSKTEQAMQYATDNGAKITSNSYGGSGDGSGLYDGVNYQNTHGVLFVAAAGNGGSDGVGDDNDIDPVSPANIDLPNVITVASCTQSEVLSDFSNFGATSVDIVAPGSTILSTAPGGTIRQYMSGTSMACPQVAGAAALLYSAAPGLSQAECKAALMQGVDTFDAYAGKCVSNGRLNINNSLELLPPPEFELDTTSVVFNLESGETDQTTVVVSNAGRRALVYTVTDDVAKAYTATNSNTAGGPIYDWIDISTNGTALSLADDGESALISLDFDFPFFGETYEQFLVGENGGIGLAAGEIHYINTSLPSQNIPQEALLPFWTDMHLSSGGSILYHGTSERLVVSWLGVPVWTGLPGQEYQHQTFQAVFYPDGHVLFQYQTVSGVSSVEHTVGIQGSGVGHQLAYNSSYLKNAFAVEFTPVTMPDWLSYGSDEGVLQQGESNSFTLTVDATGLTEGSYTGDVLFVSNDPVTANTHLPVVLVVGGDGDGDGMQDDWETFYFGSPVNTDPNTLSSNGVQTIWQAYVSGIDPTDPTSIFSISGIEQSLGNHVLQWDAVAGRVYNVHWRTNLTTGSFTMIASNLVTGTYTDTMHKGNDEDFYKIEVQLAP